MGSLSAFYERWFPGEVNHLAAFHQHVAARAPVTGRMLDVGCGANDLLAVYRTNDREVWGCDFQHHPELQHGDWFRLLQPDGSIPFASNTFDLVTSFMVMEHVESPVRFLAEIARILKPGGIYIGQSIHGLHYVTAIRRLFDLLPHEWVQRLVKRLYGREEHDTFPTHYRMNRRIAIEGFARKAGLDWAGWQTYPSQGYFAFSPLLFRGAVMFDWTLERMRTDLGMVYFTVILSKRREAGPRVIQPGRLLAA